MTGHKANFKQDVGLVIHRGGVPLPPQPAQPDPPKPVTLTLIFGNPNNESTRRMTVQVMPGQSVDVAFGTFPLRVIRED